MKRLPLLFAAIAAISLNACDNASSSNADDDYKCASLEYEMRCINDTLIVCQNGVAYISPCNGDNACKDDKCITPHQACDPGDYQPSCFDSKSLLQCVNNTPTAVLCAENYVCDNNECKPASNIDNNLCSESSFIETCADDNNLYTCKDGLKSKKLCEFGCSNDACNPDPGGSSNAICGNRKLEDGEKCDTWEVGSLTCADVPGIPELNDTEIYMGAPKCASDCQTLELGSCYVSKCGNGFLDNGELCDASSSPAHSTFPSCDDYFDATSRGLVWKDGGEPGCSSDCKGYSKGSCQLADQPRDGINSCEFSSLEEYTYDGADTTYLQGSAYIVTDGSISDDTQILGELACGHRNTETYRWSFKTGTYGATVVQDETDPNKYTLQAWLDPSTWNGGSYDCIFRVNSRGGDGGFYLCPIVQGPPGEEGITDDSKIRTYDVQGEQIDGTVLAYWDFESGFTDNSPAKPTATTLYPADGALSSHASFAVTGDSDHNNIMTMLGGTGSDGTYAAAASNWSKNSSLNDSDKHFTVAFTTLGYTNIRVKMKVAVSSTNSRQLVAKYIVSNMTSAPITHSVEAPARVFESWDFNLESAQNSNSVTLNIYNYANADANATLRIDDLYIIGDKL